MISINPRVRRISLAEGMPASRLEWQKLREHNEAFDCRVYARAAAWIAGADRWTEATWSDLEKQVGISEVTGGEQRADPDTPSDNIAGPIRRRPRRYGRRVSIKLHESNHQTNHDDGWLERQDISRSH